MSSSSKAQCTRTFIYADPHEWNKILWFSSKSILKAYFEILARTCKDLPWNLMLKEKKQKIRIHNPKLSWLLINPIHTAEKYIFVQ